MSYDVSVAGEFANCTSNMRDFLVDFDAYPPDWDGLSRAAVADRIEEALTKIRATPLGELKMKYDAPNGWGSVDSTIRFLESVLFACRRELQDRVEVWW